MDKENVEYIYTTEYYSAVKKSDGNGKLINTEGRGHELEWV